MTSIRDKINQLLGRSNRKNEDVAPSYPVLTTSQVAEKGNTATILFEAGPDAFYSDSRGSDVRYPDILVLHKDDQGHVLMTWHGTREREVTESLNIYEEYSYTEKGFTTRGLYLLNEKQAKTLLESSGETLGKTLDGIQKQKNLASEWLTDEAEKRRSDFIKKDFKLAQKLSGEYLDGIKKQDEAYKQKIDEQREAEQNRKINENTEKFLGIFSKFDSQGR